MTIADFPVVASLSSFEAVGHDLSKYKRITAYLAKMKTEIEGYQETNGEGAEVFGAWAKAAIPQA